MTNFFVVDDQVYLRLPITILDGLASMTTFLRFPRRIKTYYRIFNMLEDVKIKRKSSSCLKVYFNCYSLYLLNTYGVLLSFRERTYPLGDVILLWNEMLSEIKRGVFPKYRKNADAKYCYYEKSEHYNAIIINAGFSLVLKTTNSKKVSEDDIADFGILL